ncbi:hypothetical protein ACIA8G_03600 [Lentzea sp. NPDC051213]|uniref:hypothetical protein n=1 Tax=Lentzea sp. NPDC051213 TaxID=3364126 RepID=UPI0037B7F926
MPRTVVPGSRARDGVVVVESGVDEGGSGAGMLGVDVSVAGVLDAGAPGGAG